VGCRTRGSFVTPPHHHIVGTCNISSSTDHHIAVQAFRDDADQQHVQQQQQLQLQQEVPCSASPSAPGIFRKILQHCTGQAAAVPAAVSLDASACVDVQQEGDAVRPNPSPLTRIKTAVKTRTRGLQRRQPAPQAAAEGSADKDQGQGQGKAALAGAEGKQALPTLPHRRSLGRWLLGCCQRPAVLGEGEE
jgi:hypothetical protein